MDEQAIEAYVKAAAAALDLPIAPENLPGVKTYFAMAAAMAGSLGAFPLDIEDEPATIFVPVSPDKPA
jgi:hypothetical protein